MDLEFLIPITLFVSIAYAIKAVVDARVRRHLVQPNVSQELVRSIVESEELRRRHGSLRWGIVLAALGAGFALIEVLGWQEVTPGGVGLLLICTGIGNLVYWLLTRRAG